MPLSVYSLSISTSSKILACVYVVAAVVGVGLSYAQHGGPLWLAVLVAIAGGAYIVILMRWFDRKLNRSQHDSRLGKHKDNLDKDR
jgi:membrane protein implicated in regulation of membrane protease activity